MAVLRWLLRFFVTLVLMDVSITLLQKEGAEYP